MDRDAATQAERTLAELDTLRQRAARRAHGGVWLPATGVATLLLASTALYATPFGDRYSIVAEHPFWAGLPDQQRSPVASYLFWFLGIPLLFSVVAFWYRWRAGRLGVRVPWRAVAAAGLGVLALLAVLAAVPTGPVPDGLTAGTGPNWEGLLTPLLPVAATVVALGWVERSRGLLASGVWILALAVWLCTSWPMGTVPGWMLGNDAGGQLAWRPGHYLVLMALPLLVTAAVTGVTARRAARD
ncbi:hypothetical protein [Micromonospora sp. NPDC126480]|uniref:hypothetical protein n=1 Tax=Micromonospora sp. NPDC126480 TaxID=3155312 RepID=UPI003329228B